MIYNSVLDLIGNTSILRLNNICDNIYLKLENKNPGGSTKDRAVLNMIEVLEENNKLQKGDVLVEATSGNTGIALSMIGRLKGYDVIIIMPDTMSIERIQLMKAYGSKVILTDGALGMNGSIEHAKELLSKNKNYKNLNQFENKHNNEAHYKTTAKEIINDINDIDIFIAGVGTGGTLCGIAKYLKEQNNKIKIIAIEPKKSPIISQNIAGKHKIQGIGAGFIPKNYDKSLVDEIILIDDYEAYEGVKILAAKESILLGLSSGANIYGAIKIASKFPDKKIVTIAPDGIEKYISLGIFD